MISYTCRKERWEKGKESEAETRANPITGTQFFGY
jgi:hypothetical protein